MRCNVQVRAARARGRHPRRHRGVFCQIFYTLGGRQGLNPAAGLTSLGCSEANTEVQRAKLETPIKIRVHVDATFLTPVPTVPRNLPQHYWRGNESAASAACKTAVPLGQLGSCPPPPGRAPLTVQGIFLPIHTQCGTRTEIAYRFSHEESWFRQMTSAERTPFGDRVSWVSWHEGRSGAVFRPCQATGIFSD